MAINTMLKELRQKKGMTQAEAAVFLGVNLSSYQKYERSKNTIIPSIDVLVQIADRYNITLDYLLERETPAPKVIKPNDTELETALLEAYRAMPDEVRKEFLDHIRKAVLAQYIDVSDRAEYTLGELEDMQKAREAEHQDGGKFA